MLKKFAAILTALMMLVIAVPVAPVFAATGTAPSSSSAVTLSATQGHSVSGRVTLNGKGLSRAIITSGSYRAVSSSTGRYTLKGIPAGTNVNLTVSKYGYSFSTLPGFTMGTVNVTGQDFTATRLPHDKQISGTITIGATSQPLRGARVVLTWQNRRIGTAVTDRNGAYKFTNVVATNGFHVQPFRANYAFIPAGFVVVSTVSFNPIVNFHANHVAVVSGMISGLPAGTQVTATATGSGSNVVTKQITIGKNKRYTLPPLIDDTYTLTFAASGYTFQPSSATLTIHPGINRLVKNFKAIKS